MVPRLGFSNCCKDMRVDIHTSILQLTLIGFSLVMFPLIIALVSTYLHIDQLADDTHIAVNDSAQAVEASRIVMAQVMSMGRSAGQYEILHDKSLLKNYESQRDILYEALASLSSLSLSPDLHNRLNRLQSLEISLYEKLKNFHKGDNTKKRQISELNELTELVRPIPILITQIITKRSDAINANITGAQTRLMWQAIGLAPMAITLTIIFSILITRPLRHLGLAINRLGSGNFDEPVTVKGPHDIQELSRHLDWLRRRLASLDEQKKLFLSHVSHELKSPLTAIREGAELLHEEIVGPLNIEQKEVTHILQDSSIQLQGHVEALLSFNLALAQERDVALELIEMQVLIPDIIKKYKLTLRSRNIKVLTTINDAFIYGDRNQIKVIIDNLVSNAIKYSQPGGTIKLTLRSDNQYIYIDVLDNGIGIESDEISHIFEPFYQGRHLPQGHIKGTGLGLAIAKRYVELHNGKLELIKSTNGSHFCLTLPSYLTGKSHVA